MDPNICVPYGTNKEFFSIYFAIANHCLNELQRLLDSMPNVKDQRYLLEYAATNGNFEIFKFLVNFGIKMDLYDDGSTDVIYYIVSYPSPFNNRYIKNTSLHFWHDDFIYRKKVIEDRMQMLMYALEKGYRENLRNFFYFQRQVNKNNLTTYEKVEEIAFLEICYGLVQGDYFPKKRLLSDMRLMHTYCNQDVVNLLETMETWYILYCFYQKGLDHVVL